MTAVVPDPLIDTIIDGKYRIEARIGSGGMGTAYKALHVGLGAPRAIKVMKRELAADKGLVDRFQNEARLAEGLRHPHLVALYDFAQLPDGSWFIVSEYVEGETVAALLGEGARFSSRDVAHLLGQIADGLAVAHRKGIVHRDISPDNIMVTKDEAGEPLAKLLDFGIAKDVLAGSSSQTGASLLLGKPGYASPEQLGLLPKSEGIDGRSDVFSLAAVAHEMLVGRLPWRKDSLQSYVHDILVRPESETKDEIRAHAPEAWQGALRRGLARERSGRTPTMHALQADMLEAARRMNEEAEMPTISAVATPTVTRRAAPAPSRRDWVRPAAVALSAIALLAAGWLTRLAFQSEGTGAPAPAVSAATPSADAAGEPPAAGDSVAPIEPQASLAAGSVSLASPEAPPPAEDRSAAAPPGPSAPRETSPPARGPRRNARASEPTSARATPSAPLPIPAEPATPRPGAFVVSSTPAAAVTLDGQARGMTPLTVPAVAPGRHTLLLTTEDGRTFEDVVEVTAGATVETAHRFPGFGSLAITSDVWYEVSIDGGPPQQTPLHVDRLMAGRHAVRARRPGYKEKVFDVEILEGDTFRIALERE